MIHSYISLKSPYERAQIKWVLWGTGIFAVVFISTITLPTLFGRLEYYNAMLPTLFFAFIPVTMAIAITTHRLMDIDTLFDNTFIYTITLSILVFLDMGVISFFANLKSETFRVSGSIETIAEVWLIIFAYVPVRNNVRKAVKKILKRENYNLNEATLKLSNGLLSASDISSVLEKVNGILNETLHPKGGEFFLSNEREPFLLGHGLNNGQNKETAFKQENGLLSSFPQSVSGNPVSSNPSGCRIKSDVRDRMLSNGRISKSPQHLYSIYSSSNLPPDYSGGVIVPLIGSTATLGYMTLKNKYSGRLYSDEDFKLLSTIANQTSITIENLYNRQEAARKEREAWEEKQRISRDLHDGVGGIVANINLIAEMAQSGTSADSLKQSLSKIAHFAKEGMSEITSFMQSLDDSDRTWCSLEAELRDMGSSMTEPHNIAFDMKSSVVDNLAPINGLFYLNLLRIYREAVTNVIKHAKATAVTVLFEVGHNNLRLSVKDNGIGFTGEKSNGRGLANMKTRAREIGGEMRITSDMGSCITLEIPMPVKINSQ